MDSSSPIRRIMVKPKRTFLLLLIGAAIIVTVIWSTRSVTKPALLAAEQNANKYGFIRKELEIFL